MKINVSLQAHSMLKFVLTTTGEKEVDQKGNEINSPLRLNGEESAQRRHYFKLLEPTLERVEKELLEASEAHMELVKKEKDKLEKTFNNNHSTLGSLSEEEKDAKLNKVPILIDSFKKLQALNKKLNEEKTEVEVTEKTAEVIKKYFKEYGDKIGFASGDDSVIEELNEIL